MKFSHVFPVALLSLAFAMMPGHAQSLGVTVSQPGLFSYQAPKGWYLKNTAYSKYKVCFDVRKINPAPNINVELQTSSKSLPDFVASVEKDLKESPFYQNVEFTDEAPFETAAGIKGTRLVVKDTVGKVDGLQIFYFFEGPSDTKFIVSGLCPAGEADHYTPIFDASMKTFSLK